MFRKTTNPVTGNPVLQCAGVLVFINHERGLIENKNGNKSYSVGVEVPVKGGGTKVVSALMNKANYDYGVEEGKSYLTRIERRKDQEPIVTVSHLQTGNFVSDDLWDWEDNTNFVAPRVPDNLEEIRNSYRHADGTPIGNSTGFVNPAPSMEGEQPTKQERLEVKEGQQ